MYTKKKLISIAPHPISLFSPLPPSKLNHCTTPIIIKLYCAHTFMKSGPIARSPRHSQRDREKGVLSIGGDGHVVTRSRCT